MESTHTRRMAARCIAGLAALAIAASPVAAAEGGLAIGTIVGFSDDGARSSPVRGYLALVNLADRGVRPVATAPDPAECGGQQMLRRETTLAWQRRTGATLAFNGGFWWMPSDREVPACQLPPPPYKAAEFVLTAPPGATAPAVLALREGSQPFVGYANETDLDRFDVVLSGDWVRNQDGRIMHRNLLRDGDRGSQEALPGPRTAVGMVTATGRLLVVVIEGRRADAEGLTLAQLSALMRACGVRRAINLDGGGSSSFSYRPPAGSGSGATFLDVETACDQAALRAVGLRLQIRAHDPGQPLRSRPPGGKAAVEVGQDAGYRQVLTNIGFTIGPGSADR